MARRNQHYEAGFADYMRSRAVPFVPVDETRKSIFAGAKVKSFDFLVYPGGPRHWLVDIKGRQFPYINAKGAKRYWENWVTQEDMDSLADWQEVFGDDFEARFVFAYGLSGDPQRWPEAHPHPFRQRHYAFYVVTLMDYGRHCRRRSDRWGTVGVPARVFREIAQPIEAITFWDR